MNFEDIKELLELIAARNIAEFEMERAGTRIRISKLVPAAVAEAAGAAPAAAFPTVRTTPLTALSTAAEAAAQAAAATAGESPAAVAAEDEGLVLIKSPMVGTFYRAPSPASPPYAKEGDEVTPGQVLCIVEAMKLMNEIECEISGVVVKIYPENSQPVEYGEPLFAVRAR